MITRGRLMAELAAYRLHRKNAGSNKDDSIRQLPPKAKVVLHSWSANLAVDHQPSEVRKRTVIRVLRARRKEAAGQLVRLQMVADAFATIPLPRTRSVCTCALLEVFVLMAFHEAPFS